MATKVGSIYVEIRGDDTKWKKDLASLRSAATKSGKEVSEALNSGISAGGASSGIKTISTGLTQLAQTAKIPEKQFKQTADAISASFKDVAYAVGMSRAEFTKLNESMLRQKAFQSATTQLKALSSAAGLSTAETKKLAVQMGYSSKQAQEMTSKIHGVSGAGKDTLPVFSKIAVAAAAAFVVKELWEYGNELRIVGTELSSLRFSYEAILGSQSKAAKEMQFVESTAIHLGLGLRALEDSYKGITAASIGTSLEGAGVEKVFSSVTKASAVLGLTSDQTKGTLYALEQMISKGTVSSEELRQQLGERLPGAFNLAAKAMGVTTSELSDMLKNGEVLTDDFLPKFADELENRFGKSAESAGNQARAAFENFGTAVLRLKRTLADSGIVEYMAKAARYSTRMIDGVNEYISEFKNSGVKTMSEYDSALASATEKLEKFKSIYGEPVSGNLRSEFESLVNSVDVLDKARNKLAMSLRNNQDWESYRDGMVKTFSAQVSEAEKTGKALEGTLRKEYEKTTEYRLIEAKKQLSDYMKYEDRKPEYVKMLQDEISGLEKKSNAESLAEQKKATAAYKKELKEQAKALEEFNDAYDKASLTDFDYNVSQLDKQYSEYDKYVKDKAKLDQWYADSYFDLYDAQTEKEAKTREDALKEEQRKADLISSAMEKMYQDIGLKGEENYKYQKGLLDKQAEAYKTMGVDIGLVNKWLEAENKKLWEQMVLDSDDFFAGVKIGLDDSVDDFGTWAEKGRDTVKAFASDAGDLFSDLMFDRIKGDMDDFSDYFKSFGDSILSGVTGSISQQMTGSILSGAWSLLGSEKVEENTASLDSLTSGTYQLDDSLGQLSGTMTMFNSDFKDYASELNNSIGDLSGSLAKTATSSTSSLFSGSSGGIWGLLGAVITLNESYQTSKGNRSDDQTQYLLDILTTRVLAQDVTGYVSEANRWLGFDSGSWQNKLSTMSLLGLTNPENILEGFSILGGFDSLFSSADNPWIKYKSGSATNSNLDYTGSGFGIQVQDISNKNSVANAMGKYFESLFASIDEQVNFSFSDIVSSISTSITIHPGEDETFQDLANRMTDIVFKKYADSLSEATVGSDISSYFDFAFFKSIKTDTQDTYMDTFLSFYDTVQSTSDFVGEFERRIYELGETGIVAYQSIVAVNEILSAMSDLADETEKSDLSGTLEDITTTFDALTESMQDYNANLTQLAEAETNYNKALGATLTTLSASSIQSALVGNDSISSVVTDGITAFVASVYAESIMSEFLNRVNEDIGAIYRESGGDIASILDYISNIDLSGVNASVDEYNTLINELTGSINEASTATENASTLISRSEAKANFESEAATYIDTLNDEMDARQDAIDELQATIDSFDSLAESIRGVQDEILGTSSALTTEDSYSRAKSKLTAAYEALKSGDASGLSDISNLLTAFSSASEKYQSTIGGANSDLSLAMTVANLAADMAGQQTTYEEQQIAELEQQNEHLASIVDDVNLILGYISNSSDGSVVDNAGYTAGYAYASSDFLTARNDLFSTYTTMAKDLYPEAYSAYWDTYHAMEASGDIPAFASGGTVYGPTMAIVGEAGVEHITPDSQMKDVKDQLKELNATMQSVLTNIGNNNQTSAMLYRKFDDIERGRTSLLMRTA